MSCSLLEVLVVCTVWAYTSCTQSQSRIDALLAAEKCFLVAKLDVEFYILLRYRVWSMSETYYSYRRGYSRYSKVSGRQGTTDFYFSSKMLFSFFFYLFWYDFLWVCLLQQFSNMSKKKTWWVDLQFHYLIVLFYCYIMLVGYPMNISWEAISLYKLHTIM